MTFFFLHGEYAVNIFENEGVQALKENGDFIVSNVEFDASTTMTNFIGQLLGECSGSLENIQISAEDYHLLNDSTHAQEEKPITPGDLAHAMHEVGMIAAVITENRFAEIYALKNDSFTESHAQISDWAIQFFNDTKHVTEWDEYSDSKGVLDWEECIMQFIDAEITNEKLK